jgi:hypothetical protein
VEDRDPAGGQGGRRGARGVRHELLARDPGADAGRSGRQGRRQRTGRLRRHRPRPARLREAGLTAARGWFEAGDEPAHPQPAAAAPRHAPQRTSGSARPCSA